jgi:sugar O-acyltransferase (sialic acid O-acetyltransferase NeuD family)
MTKKLIIIGAGGDGRNVADILAEMNHEWNLLGFLDDNPEMQDTKINDVPVLGKISDIKKYAGCYFVVTIGNYKGHLIKKKLVTGLAIERKSYATIVHPSAWVSKYASIGIGSVVLPGVTIMANAEIGNHVFIASKSNIGHNTKVGNYTLISALVGIAGNVAIEEGCYIGLNASIRDSVIVGKGSIVGMGSVVVADIPPFCVVTGNPARILRKLDPDNIRS